MIEIKNISKSYKGVKIIDNLSLKLKLGESTALMGESGIGKTSLMRIISGLEKADSGEVTGGEKLKKSFVFQENRLLPGKSALENILCVINDRQIALEYLDKCLLAEAADKKSEELSGGMKRRLSIARSLAYGGDIFFLDEPLRELDDKTCEKMLELIKRETAGKTLFLITHDESHAKLLADRVLTTAMSPLKIIGDSKQLN